MNNKIDYKNIDVLSIICNLKLNENKVEELTKYLNDNILFGLSNDIWCSLSKEKMTNQLYGIQNDLNSFNKFIDGITIDLDCIHQIQKYSNEIQILEKENEILKNDLINQNKIMENNKVIEIYKNIIQQKQRNLEKWR